MGWPRARPQRADRPMRASRRAGVAEDAHRFGKQARHPRAGGQDGASSVQPEEQVSVIAQQPDDSARSSAIGTTGHTSSDVGAAHLQALRALGMLENET